jgi:cobalamin biosynthesis Mg chelatase CobN
VVESRPWDDAMNNDGDERSGSRIDLTLVPEPMRSQLLRQLDKMPAPMRERLLREGSPMLDRVMLKAREKANAMNVATPASATDASHAGPDRVRTVRQGSGTSAPIRVQTVSPGDSTNGGVWLVAFVVAAAVAGYFALHGG